MTQPMSGIGESVERPLMVEAVWKHQRRQLWDTASATLGLRGPFSDAHQLRRRTEPFDGRNKALLGCRGAQKRGYTPTNIIAFIAFLIPRMLSTRLKL